MDIPNASILADRSRAQDVNQINAQLEATGHDANRLRHAVHRPWGTYTVLEEAEDFKIKRVVVKPNGTLSLQMHHHPGEQWIVASASIARVMNGGKDLIVRTNEATYKLAGLHTA